MLAGQESVWDYPRPPRVEVVPRRARIEFGGAVIVDTADVVRVLETSHPPVYYLPIAEFASDALVPAAGSSVCEFKGVASYFDVRAGSGVSGAPGAGAVAPRAAWTYPEPWAGYEALRGRVAVYAGPMDRCLLDEELVRPQPGGFYGGWVTDDVAGPFKGVPGSMGW